MTCLAGKGLAAIPYPSSIWSSDRLHGTLIGVKWGHVLAVDENNIVTLSDHHLIIYRLEENQLTQELDYQEKNSDNWIKLSLFDVDGNGTDEIIVTALGNRGVHSQVFQIVDSKLKKLTTTSLYLGVISWEDKKIIVAQKKLGGDDFSGPFIQMEWDGKKLISKGKTHLPGGLSGESMSLYSVNGTHLGKKEGFLYLHPEGTLYYYEEVGNGKYRKVWSSGESYGGAVDYLNIPIKNPLNEVVRKSFLVPVSFETYQPSVTTVTDPNNTNEPSNNFPLGESPIETYLVKNSGYLKEVTGAVPSIKNAQFVRLVWTGYGFQENWNSPRLDGAITDFQLVDWDNDGKPEILASLLLRDQGYIDTLKKQDSILIVIKVPE